MDSEKADINPNIMKAEGKPISKIQKYRRGAEPQSIKEINEHFLQHILAIAGENCDG